MAYATGEVVPTPDEDQPFKVVFTAGGKVLDEWPVASVANGERQIVEVLKRLRETSEKDGDV